MNGVMVLIAILFAFLYGSINYYIGLRVWQNLGINYPLFEFENILGSIFNNSIILYIHYTIAFIFTIYNIK